MRSDEERLKDILDFINKTTEEFNKDEFLHKETYRYGLLKYLEIIGEAARSLKQETRDQAEINWTAIISFRNIAVHVYHDLDWDSVLDIIENHLHDLREKIEELLKTISDN